MKAFWSSLYICALFFSFHFAHADVKAVVFDCDGVLVESEGRKLVAWQHVLEKRGIHFTEEEYISCVGHPGTHILEKICAKHDIEYDPTIIDKKNQTYEEFQAEKVCSIEPMMDIVKIVTQLRKEGRVKLAVASSANKKQILSNLKSLGILDSFDVVLSGKDDLKMYKDKTGVNKPKPYIYQEACLQLGVEPKDCLVFEDSGPGVEAAAAAGCQVIAIPNKWTHNHSFDLAHHVVDVEKPELLDCFHTVMGSVK